MPLCSDCTNMPNDRCKHQKGRTAATPTTPAEGCGYFQPKQQTIALQPADPLTPAERAELAAFEARHPHALMDAGQVARWEWLRRKARG